jgi:hypothetical protein
VTRYFRKVFKVAAADSPNVRYAQAQLKSGQRVTGEEIVPGILNYEEYLRRRATWDPIRQCIGLDAQFYKGKELLLYPPDWLNMAEERWKQIYRLPRRAVAVGIDPAEGGDRTSMCAIDELGIIELVSRKTPDTAAIVSEALAFLRKHDVPPERAGIDPGGGGKQHADRMALHREPRWPNGCKIRTIAFGESLSLDPKRGLRLIEEKKEIKKEKYTYKNRRAQMFHELSLALDSSICDFIFAIPPVDEGEQYMRLRRSMAPIPKLYDEEGRIWMLPKNKRVGDKEGGKQKCLIDLIGFSPDELDSLVVAKHVHLHKERRQIAGAR